MNRLPKEKRDQLILVGIAAISAVAVLWFFLLSNQQENLRAMRQKTTEAKAKIAQAEEALKKGSVLDDQLGARFQQVRAIEDSMASGDLYSWVITTMKNFIGGHNVSLPLFSREVVGEVGIIPKFPYRAATFQLKGNAYYHDFGKFLADFENGFPYVRVQNLEFTPSTAGNDNEKLDVKFEIVTLIKPSVP